MQARTIGLSRLEQLILIALLVSLPMFLFPGTVGAQEPKSRLITEIKNFPVITIPEIPQFSEIPILYDGKITIESEKSEQPVVEIPAPVVAAPSTDGASLAPKEREAKPVTPKKVYMHEPEIRAYVCPKLGNKCNTFIAILKAENGTHECTRDNKGLNKNGSVDIGLAQINWNPKYNPPYTMEQLRDCKFNLDIALKKVESRGFQPWVAYNKGLYKKHLSAIR